MATNRLLSVIESETSFRGLVTVVIDITTVPYYGDVDGMWMVSGLNREKYAFKFVARSSIGWNFPLVWLSNRFERVQQGTRTYRTRATVSSADS